MTGYQDFYASADHRLGRLWTGGLPATKPYDGNLITDVDKLELVGRSTESSAADSVQDRIGITGDMPFEVREQFRAPAGASGRAA